MRKLILLLLITPAFAQFSQRQAVVFTAQGKPANQATVTVCASSDATCVTPITVYSSSTGAAKSNPFQTDTVGNYSFYAKTGYYTVKEAYQGSSYIYQILIANPAHNVAYADQFTGADIGVKINAAVAYLGAQGGTLIVPSGSYSFSTTIVKPRNVLLQGQGAQATILNYTGSTVAMVIGNTEASAPTGFTSSEYGLQDFSLIGPSALGSAIGIYLGGDPAGIISPANYFANAVTFSRIQIEQFGFGIQWGNNAYKNHCFACTIKGNGVGVYLPPGTTNSGENISFSESLIANNVTYAVQQDMSNSDLHFFGTSIDYNSDTVGPDLTGTSLYMELVSCHLEKTSGSFLNQSNGTVRIFGSLVILTGGSGTDAYMFRMFGTGPSLEINGAVMNSGHTVTQAIKWDATTTGPKLNLTNLQLSGITATINSSFVVNANTYVDDLIAGKRIIGSGISFGTSPATTGFLNFPNAQFLNFRNAANNADVAAIGVDASNHVVIDFAGSGATTGGTLGVGAALTAPLLKTTTNCSAVGTSASPSVAACSAAPAGSFSCATNASTATCTVNTTAVTANSQIFVTEDETLGTRLGVTCNTSTTVLPAARLLASRSAGVSFTINLGTVTTNPACFSYWIVN